MTTPYKIPFYAKITLILLGLAAFTLLLYIGQDIIIPLVYSTLIAILLNPVVNFLTRLKINRTLAIFISILLAIIVIGSVVYFIYTQLSIFKETFPKLEQKMGELINSGMNWMGHKFNVSYDKMNENLQDLKSNLASKGGAYAGATLNTLGGIFVLLFLLPVYTFFILYYKSLLLEFIRKLFDRANHETVVEVMDESRSLIQSYLVGLLAEALIVAILNSTALLILGVEYAILIGVIGALLNIIPYLGGLIAVALPMLIALVNNSPTTALLVFAAYMVVQFIDNNLIVPRIVASRVKLNALISIIIVLIGGQLWGLSGMFLSLPLTAIIKVIFDRVETLKPWGYLLGDDMPRIVLLKFKRPVNKKPKAIIKSTDTEK